MIWEASVAPEKGKALVLFLYDLGWAASPPGILVPPAVDEIYNFRQ